MDRSGKTTRRTLIIALLLAVLLHLFLGPVFLQVVFWLDRSSEKETVKKPEMVSLTLEKKIQATKPNKQVVALPPPRHEKVPRKPTFVSEFNSTVKKETQARHKHAGKYLSNRSNPMPGESDRTRPTSGARTGPNPVHRNGRSGASPLDMRPEQSRKGEQLPEGDQSRAKGAHPSPRVKPLSLAELTPSSRQIERALGSAFPDALSDVSEGDQTLLNTKRWRFSSFFNRVKSAVAQQWHPDKVYKRRDPTGKVYGLRSRLTVLRVWLYPDGKLKQVIVVKSSGLDFLDDEAIRAFRAAAPFPNPPRRLVDRKTHLITFRFGFLFEIVQGPIFKIFRYR